MEPGSELSEAAPLLVIKPVEELRRSTELDLAAATQSSSSGLAQTPQKILMVALKKEATRI